MTAAPEFRWQAVGRRKTSVARVYLTPGTGKWDVNGRTLGDYFPRPSLVQHIQQSFTATDTLGAFDVRAHVNGGGQAGQAVPGKAAENRGIPAAKEHIGHRLPNSGSAGDDEQMRLAVVACDVDQVGFPQTRRLLQNGCGNGDVLISRQPPHHPYRRILHRCQAARQLDARLRFDLLGKAGEHLVEHAHMLIIEPAGALEKA